MLFKESWRRSSTSGGSPVHALAWLLGLSFGISGLAQPATPSALSATPVPALSLESTIQDGGAVEQGTQLQYRFTLTNHGQADLELTQVKPDCGCTVPRWDRVIKPGAAGVIEARLDTSSFRGPIRKRLTVVTNDPVRPQIDLTLAVSVTPLVHVTPGLAARLSLEDRPVTQEFILERNGGRPMTIVQVTAGAPFIQAAVTPLPGEGRFRLLVTATAEAPLGRSTVPVVVRTDQKKASTLTLVLTVERGIILAPRQVFWSFTGGQVPLPVRGVVTVSRQARPFRITGVSVDDPKLATKLETVREGHEYRVTVTYAGGWEGGLVKKKLSITTDDPKQPQIEVPVQAVLPQPATAAPVTVTP
jgi:hypothetical protein